MIDKNSLVENGLKYTICHKCFIPFNTPRENKLCIKCKDIELAVKNKKLDNYLNK